MSTDCKVFEGCGALPRFTTVPVSSYRFRPFEAFMPLTETETIAGAAPEHKLDADTGAPDCIKARSAIAIARYIEWSPSGPD
jgi:hypothetical protein